MFLILIIPLSSQVINGTIIIKYFSNFNNVVNTEWVPITPRELILRRDIERRRWSKCATVFVIKYILDHTGRFPCQMITGVRQEGEQQYVELVTKC